MEADLEVSGESTLGSLGAGNQLPLEDRADWTYPWKQVYPTYLAFHPHPPT